MKPNVIYSLRMIRFNKSCMFCFPKLSFVECKHILCEKNRFSYILHPQYSKRKCRKFQLIFQNLTFLKDLKKNVSMSPFCIPKVLKKCHKHFENRLTNKNFMQENIFEQGFFHFKIASKGSNYFPGKNLNCFFFI